MVVPVAERLERLSIPEPNSGCWLWTGFLHKSGYGRIAVSHSISRFAHRVSYETFKCEIPDGLELDHLCRVRCCINPDHLEPVTHQINALRGETGEVMAALNRDKTHCPQGHEYTPENTYIPRRGGRNCRRCKLEAQRRYAARKDRT